MYCGRTVGGVGERLDLGAGVEVAADEGGSGREEREMKSSRKGRRARSGMLVMVLVAWL
jgi:hypothetical protein